MSILGNGGGGGQLWKEVSTDLELESTLVLPDVTVVAVSVIELAALDTIVKVGPEKLGVKLGRPRAETSGCWKKGSYG